MRISDWSSDVCSSDLRPAVLRSGNSGLCRASGCLLEQTWPQSFCDLAQMRVARAAAASKNVHMRVAGMRSEEHTSELQSLMRISYAVFCLKKKKKSYSH